MQNVLMTGATGFLGSQIVRKLMENPACTVYAVVRSQGNLTALERLERLFSIDESLATALRDGRIIALEGDITLPLLGLSEGDLAAVQNAVDYVIHAAAEVRINQPAATYQRVNVDGTRNACDVAACINQTHSLKRFVHLSTAYVAGTMQGVIPEAPLSPDGFNSLYERSKHEAEGIVQAYANDFPCSVVRPAQIVGRVQDGYISTFNTLYYPLKMYLKGKLSVLPVSGSQKLNMVPVDYVADVAIAALNGESEECRICHAVLPGSMQPTVKEALDATRAWAQDTLGVKLPKVRFVPMRQLGAAGAKRNNDQTEQAKPKSFAANMLALSPYFNDKHEFQTDNTRALVGACALDWRAFFPNMLEYGTRQGFLNHTGRTVFEQMLVRLSAQKNVLTYTNVTDKGMDPVAAADMKQRILDAANALLAVGVNKGDRVALTGVNSADYMAADAAIGLIGAVSVPLYFTTPGVEAQELIERSKSKLLLVGAKRLAKHAAEGGFSVPCVVLPQAGQVQGSEELTPWETFLAIGRQNSNLLDKAPAAGMDDLATIRYTSGTTGKPKGVMFTQGQLVWMAQTMGSVLDWKTRNGAIRYLSFLPMSHVVEGILVAYAPYYLLTDVSIFCLNNFDALVPTLPKVKPSIFFSVPRFYEKLWDQFMATGAGQRYVAMKEGPAKAAFGKICKSVLLKKAGLQSCRQLIVGSAPMSLDLMNRFRNLGIEVHNAFGLTEAPLITLNRLGKNDLGSLGQPLPETVMRIDEAGVIWMKGPQLTIGYDGMGPLDTDADGYFSTGDLGHYSEAGNVVIEGRQKELLVTSYGKNIQPSKVEAMLKSITGIGEALLVGDGRPYCVAVLWLDDEAAEPFDFAAMDAAVAQVNDQLSHPEAAKRWFVSTGSLSTQAGQLTPNLKIRRNVVAAEYADQIEQLYANALTVGEGVAHVGSFNG